MAELTTGKQLQVRETPIPGFLVLDLPVHGDNRGWFKENWQREKMLALGLPDFGPVQNNISFNASAGVTRGIHAEPWDKYISVASGRVFGAWVDLREGPSFGATFTVEIDPSIAVFVPRGVGNSFQALEEDTAYSYLVNEHWSAEAQGEYTFLNLADPTAAIEWPIPLEQAELSDKDRAHPMLADVAPMPPRKTLVLGANGQLGRALRRQWAERTDVEFAGRDAIDLARPETLDGIRWSQYGTIVNAAAHTAVDGAETDEGRRDAWAVNASGPARLAAIAAQHRLTLVHVSSDYVFDGAQPLHGEDEPLAPLGVYGQSKAAGDLAVAVAPKHYVLRTSWVVGEGKNFIATMASLAERGVDPSVVGDQVGRLTFAAELARAIDHLLASRAPYGTYNVSNGGEPASWADIAARVFERTGHDASRVTPVTTAEYYADKEGIAPRPLQSALDLGKLESTGFAPRDQFEQLDEFVRTLAD
ncbi:bifunctional dTDP-4-dehydrorhamnose 3,5-epimerase family protein/NAD(P)-dependent oxidoreductase [Agrococcus sp. HG114]|uniref:bifunctional dTDP-4-dehydrorhamnose 3,5-epimerase family protein/NAD(P)-dependent oxidoreductase n=1 Tax=Agrococcus sp. HG114 TaxID=2969757 RepID=UPI00215B74C4|nr:bifunctional dTDP-4-dehydrorhamnose 3,5-epimerase family protein/NAD(P)-dependent oxidoreductase [Agrococcus sp. HG114]MCR8669803.1 bifunctional dTDP-4-dehydrorhamnose 3,5-epimerase family protein/NAD(P)-dependent oxidoreductase [Agrococcus sp. HG114]